MWLPKCGNYINEGESLWWSWCKICKQVQLNIALPWFCYINVNSKLNVMETFLLSLWTLPAAQFSRVQFTFVMLFKSITYIQHAESFFKSCLRLCSNYLQSSFSLLMCKTSLCWLQGDQESTEAGSSSLIFPETNELKTSYTCVLQDSRCIIILQIVGKFHSILAT